MSLPLSFCILDDKFFGWGQHQCFYALLNTAGLNKIKVNKHLQNNVLRIQDVLKYQQRQVYVYTCTVYRVDKLQLTANLINFLKFQIDTCMQYTTVLKSRINVIVIINKIM